MIRPGTLFAKLEVRVARRRLFLRAIRPETHPFAPVSPTPAPAPTPAAAARASPRFGDGTLVRFASVIHPLRAFDRLAVSFAYRRVRARAFDLASVPPRPSAVFQVLGEAAEAFVEVCGVEGRRGAIGGCLRRGHPRRVDRGVRAHVGRVRRADERGQETRGEGGIRLGGFLWPGRGGHPRGRGEVATKVRGRRRRRRMEMGMGMGTGEVVEARVGRGWGHGDGRARRVRVWVFGHPQVREAPSIVRRLGPLAGQEGVLRIASLFRADHRLEVGAVARAELRELLDDAPLFGVRRRVRRRRPRVPTRRHGRETPGALQEWGGGGARDTRMRPTAPSRHAGHLTSCMKLAGRAAPLRKLAVRGSVGQIDGLFLSQGPFRALSQLSCERLDKTPRESRHVASTVHRASPNDTHRCPPSRTPSSRAAP